MKLRWSTRQRWWLLAGGWVAILVLGVGGFIQQADELDLNTTFLDQLYFTLQLAALDYKGSSQSINWRLQVVRFIAPLMAAGTLLQSASVVFRDQFTRWRAGRARGHTVVCGLDAVGTRLVEALVADGRHVVAIEASPATSGIATTQRAGVAVIVGDPTDPSVLSAASVANAARLVAITDSDAVNVAVTSAARSLLRPTGLPPLRCAVRLGDGELAHLLRSTELGTRDSLRVEFFNLHERAAQALIAAHPLPDPTDARPAPRLMVFGLGQFGANVLVAAAQRWAEHSAGPLAVTLIDRRARGRLQALVMQHPALRTAVDAICIDLDIGAPHPDAVENFEASIVDESPDLVVVAFEDEALAWTSALFVRRRVRRPIEIVVRTDSDGGFGQHLQGAVTTDAMVAKIVSFGYVAEACSVELIEGGVREQLARAIHDDHVARSGAGAALHRAWAELDDSDRESSRAAADAIVTRIETLGAELVPLRQWGVSGEQFTGTELDQLAAAEHTRWKAEREAAGWTWGEVRDDTRKHNPLLVEWSQLPPEAQAQNRESTAALPAMLARAGFEIARR